MGGYVTGMGNYSYNMNTFVAVRGEDTDDCKTLCIGKCFNHIYEDKWKASSLEMHRNEPYVKSSLFLAIHGPCYAQSEGRKRQQWKCVIVCGCFITSFLFLNKANELPAQMWKLIIRDSGQSKSH